MIFVDTNYFLRFLLKDIEPQHQEAKRLLKDGAEGKIKLCTSLIVFFELYWVLTSFYQKEKKELADILSKILKLEFIYLEERNLLKQAIKIFSASNLDLEDSYNLSYAKVLKVSDFKTFDKKMVKKFKEAQPI